MGSAGFTAEYQQNPVPPDGALVIEPLTRIDVPPARKKVHRLVQSRNTAIKDSPSADFSVCTTWGWLDDVWCPQVAIPTQVPWWDNLARELRAFPNVRYDDQVDSIPQFLAWIQGPRRRGVMYRDPVTGRPIGKAPL